MIEEDERKQTPRERRECVCVCVFGCTLSTKYYTLGEWGVEGGGEGDKWGSDGSACYDSFVR